MRRLLLPLALCCALLAACGNERVEAPRLVESARGVGAHRVTFPEAGVAFRAPVNWLLQRRRGPAVFTLQSGAAFVSGFAYEREEDLPASDAELADAERRLRAQVRKRDRRFRFRSSRRLTVDGAPAIELRGVQRIAGRALETRSVHVYKGEVEYVFEALAPRESFRLASDGVLAQVLRTARLRGSVRERRADRDQERRGR